MIILGIETSCDETALAILECKGGFERLNFKVIAETVHSQIAAHQQFGGVFPMVAKREHARNLIPLLTQLLTKAGMMNYKSRIMNHGGEIEQKESTQNILAREPELLTKFLEFIPTIAKPKIDAIAVTQGPGLEPALWVGINFAKALGMLWNVPVLPTNHMEGHIASVLISNTDEIKDKKSKIKNEIQFPALALLISGGHTELVLIKNWLDYQMIGGARDDAVGEAFDKVARILGLPYPGGPEISRLAEEARSHTLEARSFPLPRPMLHSGDYDFSFSGLKTAVLYLVKKLPTLTDTIKTCIAREFEDAVTDVLVHKTKKAIEEFGIHTLVVAGGVSANRHVRETFTREISALPEVQLLIPDNKLSTDNASMIAAAGYLQFTLGSNAVHKNSDITAHGRLQLPAKHLDITQRGRTISP